MPRPQSLPRLALAAPLSRRFRPQPVDSQHVRPFRLAVTLALLLGCLGARPTAAAQGWQLHPSAEDIGSRYATLDGEVRFGQQRAPAKLLLFCRSMHGERVKIVFSPGQIGFDARPYTGKHGVAMRTPVLGLVEGEEGEENKPHHYNAIGMQFRESRYALAFHPIRQHVVRWVSDAPQPAKLEFSLPVGAPEKLEASFVLPAGNHKALRQLLSSCQSQARHAPAKPAPAKQAG